MSSWEAVGVDYWCPLPGDKTHKWGFSDMYVYI
jgi:hypothetical protein